MPILPLEAIKAKEALLTYDSVDDSVLQSYSEYSLAQLIYYAMKESATSEQASRMTAMDSASKNAGEFISRIYTTVIHSIFVYSTFILKIIILL
ncbi:hypothetical protein OESDEN_18350 [Oesophagostomum dentatum]|uniref:ATP synthase n=1 Tax=Oesophagostomum dentatum TaxID=61180 RepID=A0A0B1SFF8_OESDE|nr:hypothetical protein OESDEN_18350 [Oesophagostomum dentatum]